VNGAPIIYAEVAARAHAGLGEGAVWDAASRRLIWVDISGRSIHYHDPVTRRDASIALDQPPGVAIPRHEGGLVIALGRGFAFLTEDCRLEQIASVPDSGIPVRMNDGNCDSAGRFWAGTMGIGGELGAGSLYRLDPDRTVTRVLTDVTISNGIDWSPDDRLMYYVDTAERRVDVFDFDPATGAIEGRRTFVAIEDAVLPDGLTVDAKGGVWVACWGGAAIRRFTPDGLLDCIVSVPTRNVTSCAFGGEALDELYVTSAREGLVPIQREATAGGLFVCQPGFRGSPQRLFGG
jgi:sugar lactone lactonase YvrE